MRPLPTATGILCSHPILLVQDVWRQQTVYTVRLLTGLGRGAGIDDQNAGVFIALVGKVCHKPNHCAGVQTRRCR